MWYIVCQSRVENLVKNRNETLCVIERMRQMQTEIEDKSKRFLRFFHRFSCISINNNFD